MTNDDKSAQVAVKIILALVIIAAGAWTTYILLTQKPKAKRKKTASITPVVTTQPLQSSTHSSTVKTMGTVIAANKVKLVAEVSGKITMTHRDFIEGGLIQRDEQLIKIDETDYIIAESTAKAELKVIESDIKLEHGKQTIARNEWAMLGVEGASKEDEELVLRKPQLAALDAQKAAKILKLDQAMIDLKRCQVQSPFNAIISTADVRRGDYATPQTMLATLIDTDKFHIEVSIPIRKLQSITIPGAEVKVIANNRVFTGKTSRLLGEIEKSGRMAKVLVEVKDPLNLTGKWDSKLLLGEYVKAEIAANSVDNVITVHRDFYREGNTVWLLTAENKLAIKSVTPIWEEREHVYVKSSELPADSQLITSDLGFPIDGMQLKTQSTGKVSNEKE